MHGGCVEPGADAHHEPRGILARGLTGQDRAHGLGGELAGAARAGAQLRPGGVLRAGEGVEGLLGRALDGIPFRSEELGNPRFLCRCGPDRLDATLAALGPREARSLIAEEGEIRARCAFCAAEWRKTALEAAWERAGEGAAAS
jgi:hypothetical protein